jgi:hypothetical protein
VATKESTITSGEQIVRVVNVTFSLCTLPRFNVTKQMPALSVGIDQYSIRWMIEANAHNVIWTCPKERFLDSNPAIWTESCEGGTNE